jgi:hypothetical protein
MVAENIDRAPEANRLLHQPTEQRCSRGFVWFVGAGPGDPDLMTLRGARLLRDADVVLHDALIHPAILDDIRGHRVDVGKRCGRHSMRQEDISALIADFAARGHQVVRLRAAIRVSSGEWLKRRWFLRNAIFLSRSFRVFPARQPLARLRASR